MSLRKALQSFHPEEDISIRTGKPGEMSVMVDGVKVYDYQSEGHKDTAELVKVVARAKAEGQARA